MRIEIWAVRAISLMGFVFFQQYTSFAAPLAGECARNYRIWETKTGWGAFAADADGANCGWASDYDTRDKAIAEALLACRRHSKKCELYDVTDGTAPQSPANRQRDSLKSNNGLRNAKLSHACKRVLDLWWTKPGYKAFATSSDGSCHSTWGGNSKQGSIDNVMENCNAAYKGCKLVAATDPRDTLISRQRELSILGLYKGEMDGVWGGGSSNALDEFIKTASADPRNEAELYSLLKWAALIAEKYSFTVEKSAELSRRAKEESSTAFIDNLNKIPAPQVKPGPIVDVNNITTWRFDSEKNDETRLCSIATEKFKLTYSESKIYFTSSLAIKQHEKIVVSTNKDKYLFLLDNNIYYQNTFSNSDVKGFIKSIKFAKYIAILDEHEEILIFSAIGDESRNFYLFENCITAAQMDQGQIESGHEEAFPIFRFGYGNERKIDRLLSSYVFAGRMLKFHENMKSLEPDPTAISNDGVAHADSRVYNVLAIPADHENSLLLVETGGSSGVCSIHADIVGDCIYPLSMWQQDTNCRFAISSETYYLYECDIKIDSGIGRASFLRQYLISENNGLRLSITVPSYEYIADWGFEGKIESKTNASYKSDSEMRTDIEYCSDVMYFKENDIVGKDIIKSCTNYIFDKKNIRFIKSSGPDIIDKTILELNHDEIMKEIK